jgi:mannosyl-oligosaccharide alpha-1,2-mannosidase
MIIMDLKKEVWDALQWIKQSLHFNWHQQISVFETTIRILGGLLSAYELTNYKEQVLLDKAVDIANRLMPAFQTPSGVPVSQISLANGNDKSNHGWTGGNALLAEFATLQLEFRRLSQLTGDKKYDQAVTRVMDLMYQQRFPDDLYPSFFNVQEGKFTNDHITFGAWGDSAFEYFLKQYLLTNKTEERYKEMYLNSMQGMFDHMLLQSKPNNLYYVAEWRRNMGVDHKMDHLVCFTGGMLALGHYLKVASDKKHLDIGAELTRTCNEMYVRTQTGLSSETVVFNNMNDFNVGVPTYILRPETVESIFYMYRITKDNKYREWGWRIFEALESHTKVYSGGYTGLLNVNVVGPNNGDDMQQSFFLAETLKYLYLLFSSSKVIPIDQWVFNTEAHPLRITTPTH